jgi:hypothetical protein
MVPVSGSGAFQNTRGCKRLGPSTGMSLTSEIFQSVNANPEIYLFITTMTPWFSSSGMLAHYQIPEKEHAFLEEKREELLNTTGLDRGRFVQKVWEEIRDRSFDTMSAEELEKGPKMVCFASLTIVVVLNTLQGVLLWFHRYGRKTESQQGFQWMRKWTIRQVIAKEYKSRHKELIQTASGGAKPGSSEYLKHYHTCLSTLIDELDDEVLSKAARDAEIWSMLAPPKEIQAKYVVFDCLCCK